MKKLLRKLVAALACLPLFTAQVVGQGAPTGVGPFYQPNWYKGYVPTALEWQMLWSNKVGYYSTGIPVQYGGTGATTAAGARTSLGVVGSALPSGQIYVGSAGGVATAVTPSGDVSMSNVGNFTVVDLAGVTNASLANSGLVNSATTVNGQTCTLGASCTVTAAATGVTVGSTTITGGTSGRVLYDNAGVLGEMTTSGTGTQLALTNSPTFTTPVLGAATGTSLSLSGALSTSSTATNAIAVNAAAATVRSMGINTAGSTRWTWGGNATAESGANAGSDFFLNAHSDAGAYMLTPIIVTRSSGLVTLGASGAVVGPSLTVGTGAGTGKVQLVQPASATQSGYVAFLQANNNRIGYIGFGNTSIQYVAELASSFHQWFGPGGGSWMTLNGSSTSATLQLGTATEIGIVQLDTNGDMYIRSQKASRFTYIGAAGANIALAGSTGFVAAVDNTLVLGNASNRWNALRIGTGTSQIDGTLTLGGALTYGGVTLSNAVTGTGSMVLATSPTLTTPNIGAATGTSLATTAALTAYSGTAIPAGGTAGSGLKVSSTANFGVFFGSGAPTLSAAQGSVYLSSSGAPYYNNNGTTGWTQFASSVDGVPVGSCYAYGGSSIPSGWVQSYGQAISRTTFAAAFAVFGTTYGSGDGSTTFNMPDLRGRAVFGDDRNGGSAANRLGGNSSTGGISGTASAGTAGGEQTHVQTLAEMANHNHTATGLLGQVKTEYITPRGVGWGDGTNAGYHQDISVAAAGSSSAFNITPPALVMNYICKVQ